jgi:hypothetical protein
MGRSILNLAEANRILRDHRTYCRWHQDGEETVCTGGSQDYPAPITDLALLIHFGYFRPKAKRRAGKPAMEFTDHKFVHRRTRNRKLSPQREFERMAASLPPMPEEEREAILREAAGRLGIDYDNRRSHAGY